jgi:ABC-type multidrug transport system ATPase subunit
MKSKTLSHHQTQYPMSSILSIHSIHKSYGNIQALKGISFEIPQGSVFGILGPNGSGKTTLLGILLDVLKADSGDYSWFGGTDAAAARKQIGALLETPNFYAYLSAVRNLQINAQIKGKSEADIARVLEIVQLTSRKDSKFSTYSLGMKQRLAIANALLGNPKVLVLDEPTNGLDPEGIAEVRDLIKRLSHSGITIIMASHLLDEIEKVCTHVTVLKKGDLLLTGNIADAFGEQKLLEVKSEHLMQLKSLLQQLPAIKNITEQDDVLLLTLSDDINATALNKHCFEQGIVLSHLNFRKKSLENQFMELTKG